MEVAVTKSKTWKRNRDERKRVSESEDTVALSEVESLIKGTRWGRGWADRIEGAQIGIAYLIRRGVDEVAVVQWPAYEGWGGSGTQVPRSALTDTQNLLDNPPPPKLKSPV